MKPVNRTEITDLEKIPNVGPAIAANLRLIGVSAPQDLLGKDPYTMYDNLCHTTGVRPDPCVIDVFISFVLKVSSSVCRRGVEGRATPPMWASPQERPLKSH
jgi:hypothetical protein